MADSLELVPTLSDVGRQQEIAMAAYKPEVVITQERHEISARFQQILDIFDHAQHAGAISNIVRCRPTFSRQPEIAMAICKPEVVITQDSSEISKATPTFSTMADFLELVPTLYDVGRQPEIVMAAYKAEVVISQERYEISARFQWILDIFDHAQHAEAIANIVRYRPTSDRQPEIAMSANKPVFWPPLLFLVVGRMSSDNGQCWR